MKSYSFFIKLFVSLTLLLLIPVIIIETISNYAILSNSENEISNNSLGKLKMAENTLTQLEDRVFNDSVRLSVNSTINVLENYGSTIDRSNGENLIQLGKVMDTLSELVKLNNKYESVYLYLDDFDYELTSNYEFIKKDKFSDNGWLKYYNEYKKEKIVLSMLDTRIPRVTSPDSSVGLASESVISYIYPLTPYTTNLDGALVINIKEAAVENLINSSNIDTEGYIFIINKAGDVITHPNSGLLTMNILQDDYIKKITSSSLPEGHLTSVIDGKKSLVSYYKSNINGWIFIGVFPLSTLNSKADSIRAYTIYASLLIIIIGIFISFIISKKIYSPVEKLIKDIKEAKGIDFNRNDDEMSILSKAINTLSKQDKNLFDILEKTKREVRENYLKDLLNGGAFGGINKDIIGDNFIHNSFVCVAVAIDKYNSFAKNYDKEQHYYMKNLICQVTDEVMKLNFTAVSVNLRKGEIAVIINTDGSNPKIQEDIQKGFEKIQEELAKVLENSMTISIGTIHQGTMGIRNSYFEAQTGLKQKLKLGYGSIILWNEEFTDNNYYYPIKIEEHLLNYLRLQSNVGLEEVLNELIDDVINRSKLSSENILQIFTQLLGNTVIKYLLEEHINLYDIFGAKYNVYNELSSKETIYDIKDWLLYVYNKIVEYCEKAKTYNKKYLDDIVDYISKNYKKDIGISDISEYIGLSYSHVRKIFKDEIGENIVDYINNIRIKESKVLLSDTDMSIKDIAVTVGYNNAQSFTRFFKKFEGITPGEYRNN